MLQRFSRKKKNQIMIYRLMQRPRHAGTHNIIHITSDMECKVKREIIDIRHVEHKKNLRKSNIAGFQSSIKVNMKLMR